MATVTKNRTYGKIAGFWVITQKAINNIRNLTWGKNDQHSKIYIPYNFEVNLITHLGVISLFSSNFLNFNTFRLIFQKLYEIDVKFKLQKCVACQDLPTL
jgi:hypothetical protein